jgi:predicted nucleotidyltransferase
MSPTRQNTLDEVTRRAREKYPECLGVMLYGSFARGTETKDSDIDVFCILDDNDPAVASDKAFSRTNTVETELWEVDGYEVEVHKAKLSFIGRMLSNLAQRASHYYVHVLRDAVALYEKEGVIQKLSAEAKRIYEEGPPFPSKEEIEFGRMVFSRGLVQVKRMLRDGSSPGLLRVMADMLFVNGVNGYCTVNRIWGGNKIPKIIGDAKIAHPRLYELCQNYVSSETSEQLLANLEALLDEAVEPVGWGAAQGRAPLKEARAQVIAT